MKTKYINYIFLAFISILLSCSDWFDVSPKSDIKSEKLFSTQNGFRDALIGTYSLLATEDSYGRELSYGYVDVLAQYYKISGNEHKYSKTVIFDYENIEERAQIDRIWSRAYQAIVNTNAILHFIDKKKDIFTNESNYLQIKSEALALRAFIHFDILRLFAPIPDSSTNKTLLGIPYVDEYTNKAKPQQSVSEVIALIEKDLLEALSLMNKSNTKETSFGGEKRYHINKYAIKAMLARIMLYNGDKKVAKKYVDELIDPTTFQPFSPIELTLTPSSDNRLMISEILWSLNVVSLKNNIDNYFGTAVQENPSAPSNTALTISTSNVTRLFTPIKPTDDDYRFKYWFFNLSGNISLPYLYETTNEIPMLTIAEVYYIATECSDKKTEQLRYLNTIRAHRGLSPLENDANIEDELKKEYIKEFIGKGQMFYYFKRNNINRMGVFTTRNISQDKYTLPIPIDEIDFGHINTNN